ncbi:MAG TPA: acyltransferase family protein [Candidatus Limnocylindria bacterium]|nr:acyltransferase family protein [Candidatus Limnocylindria bacterium]
MKEHSKEYRPDIDGLRAVAIGLVFAFHLLHWPHGGFIGVDVFFVISGFLITQLLVRDIDGGKFSYAAFWERRVRRITPAVTVVVLLTAIAGYALFSPDLFASLGKYLAAQAALVANVCFWRVGGYFGDGAEQNPLLHTWSLAIEEQFYLLFPWFLVVVSRKGRSFRQGAVWVLLLVSFAYCAWLTPRQTTTAFYLLPTRAWELLVGAVTCFGVSRPRAVWGQARQAAEVASMAGLVLIVGAAWKLSGETAFPGVVAAVPTLGAALLIYANSWGPTFPARVLALPPAVWVGKISYSLYLWHWPLIVYWGWSPLTQNIPHSKPVIVALAVGLSILSYFLVEQPFRRKSVVPGRRPLFLLGFGSMAIGVALGVAIWQGNGFPGRFPAAAVRFLDVKSDTPYAYSVGMDKADIERHTFPVYGNPDTNLPIHALVWGDSHAMHFMPPIDKLSRDHGVRVAQLTHFATPPVLGYVPRRQFSLGADAPGFSEAVVEWVESHHIDTVVLAACWRWYENTPAFRQQLTDTVARLAKARCRVYVIKQVPFPAVDVPRFLFRQTVAGQPTYMPVAQVRPDPADYEKLFTQAAAAGATVLDPAPYLTLPDGSIHLETNGVPLYFDAGHVTITGSMSLAPLFAPVFTGP